MTETHDVLSKVFDLVEHYLALDDQPGDTPVVHYLPAESLQHELDLTIGPQGASYDMILKDIQDYLKYAVNTSHKHFINQLYGGRNLPAFLGEVITALTNTSMYTYEVAPAGTLIEMKLIEKMRTIIGFDDGDGTFLTGGSNANLIAMFSARNEIFPQIKNQGLYGCTQLIAYVSEQSHYSMDTAANLLGLGSDQVCKIPVDQKGRMRVDALGAAIAQSIAAGHTPFFVGATAGTTLLGAFDPIDEIVAVSKKHDLWVHVDGAFGGSLILGDQLRHLFNGLDQCDSFTMDPHKLMNIPLMCSMLLVREKGRLLRNLTDLDTKYLYHENDAQSYDLGKSSIQCGRRVDALKLWLAWRFFGDRGYASRMDKLAELATYARNKIAANDKLELMAEPQSVAVCFRYRNGNGMDINDFNLQLRENLRKTGKAIINYGHWKDQIALRYVATNPDSDPADIDTFFKYFFNTAQQMEEA